MRICFVVHRYGSAVPGGAEAACRSLAIRMAPRGHEVHVVTSCAMSYQDWADVFEPGTTVDDGVVVHRLSVTHGRQAERFAALSERVLNGRYGGTWDLEAAWMEAQGPDIDIVGWLHAHARAFDVVVFFTYLYPTTALGLPSIAGVVPTVLHPTAHDEPPLRLRVVRPAFEMADALVYLTPEERQLVDRRFHLCQPSDVIGIGIDPAPVVSAATLDDVRGRYSLPDSWLLGLGRMDPSKATPELVQWYAESRRRHPAAGLPPLVLAGDPAWPVPQTDGVIVLGVVDDDTKHALLAGASMLVHPSYFESFSLVLCEAWSHGIAVLAQGRCEVLAGQVERSGGGFAYRGFSEFDAALDRLLDDPALRARLGDSGRRFVAATLAWPVLLERYEALLAEVVDRGPARGVG